MNYLRSTELEKWEILLEYYGIYRDCEKKVDIKIEDKDIIKEKTKQELIKIYIIEYNNNVLHNYRRNISLYFQNIACLALSDWKIMKIIKDIWEGSNINIISTIIVPLETIALPLCIGEKPNTNITEYPEHILNLLSLEELLKKGYFKWKYNKIKKYFRKIKYLINRNKI